MKTSRVVPLLLLLATSLLRAENEAGRGVARVSLTNGDVTVQRGDSGDWIAAGINAPLVTGDKIHTGRASRAEVQFDYANFLRLSENTDVRLADLENQRYQLQVSAGVVTYRILRRATADVEINTPAVAVRPLERGTYRIEVLSNGETEITVRDDGKAEIASSQGTETLREGRTMIVRLGPSDQAVEARVINASGRDDWDRWNERRDKQLERSQSHRYVHNSIYGVEDLDYHGNWEYVSGYGHCWFPRMSIGWSPYSWGRWAWIDWYGWSWVGYEPWGWAPYHYGRWFRHSRYGWGWYPGSIYTPYYWSPGLVGFFGWGRHSGFNIGFGFGYQHLGWVPLAPGERYYPWYGRGYYGRGRNVYIDNSVNITNITNIRNVYRNSSVAGGIISVNAEDFARGRTANPRRVNVAEVGNAGQIRGLVPVVPDRESLRVADREVRAGSIPRTEGRDSRFFTRREPGALERVPFNEQQQQIARSIRGEAAAGGRRPEGSPAPAAESNRSIRSLGEGGGGTLSPRTETERGWRRFGEERRQAPAATGATPSPAERGADRNVERTTGWRRFGEERRSGGETVVTTPSADRNVERNTGSRRFGEERRAEPRQTPEDRAPQPSSEPRVERNTQWRRLGEGGSERESRPSEERRPIRDLGNSDAGGRLNRETPRVERRSEPPVERRSEPRFERRSEPPIERRSQPSFERRSGGGFGGQGEAPRRMEPRGGDEGRMSAPRSESRPAPSAPPSRGGDGGRGTSRSEGGARRR